MLSCSCSPAQCEDVFLDNNLLVHRVHELLLVSPRTAAVLAMAVRSDCFFLQACNIMDYSLLAGVTADGEELLVGIIGQYRL